MSAYRGACAYCALDIVLGAPYIKPSTTASAYKHSCSASVAPFALRTFEVRDRAFMVLLRKLEGELASPTSRTFCPHVCKPDAHVPPPLDFVDLQALGPSEAQQFKPAQLHTKSVRLFRPEMQTSELKLAMPENAPNDFKSCAGIKPST